MFDKKFLLVLCLFAFSLRLSFVLFMPQRELLGDSQEYDALALNIARYHEFSINHEVPTPTRAPLYPLFLALIYALGGHSFLLVGVAQALLDTLTCALTFLLCRELFQRGPPAKLAGLLYACYPVMLAHTALILSETLFTFFFILSLFLLLKGMRTVELKYFAVSGIAMGLATLTRPTTLVFPVLVATILAVLAVIPDTAERRSRTGIMLCTALYLAVYAFALVPWTVRNYRHFGVFMPVAPGGGFGTWLTGYESLHNVSHKEANRMLYVRIEGRMAEPAAATPGFHPRIQLDRELVAEGKQMLRESLGSYAVLVAKRLPRFWWTSHSSVLGVDAPIPEYKQRGEYFMIFVRLGLLGLHGLLLLLALAGSVVTLKDYRFTAVFLFSLAYFTLHVLFDPLPRYHLPVVPLLFVFASQAVFALQRKSEAAP